MTGRQVVHVAVTLIAQPSMMWRPFTACERRHKREQPWAYSLEAAEALARERGIDVCTHCRRVVEDAATAPVHVQHPDRDRHYTVCGAMVYFLPPIGRYVGRTIDEAETLAAEHGRTVCKQCIWALRARERGKRR